MVIEVDKHIRDVLSICWEAIKLKRVLQFDFESNSGNIGPREIKPYMVYLNDNEEIRVVGLPRQLWNETVDKIRQPRHYLLLKVDLKKIEVLKETFEDPGVSRDIVVNPKIVKIICRFIYNNEDLKKVAKSWVKIKGFDLS